MLYQEMGRGRVDVWQKKNWVWKEKISSEKSELTSWARGVDTEL